MELIPLENQFYEIFEELIGTHLRNAVIYHYESENKVHQYYPYRHHHNKDTEELLANFMRKYIYFYAYSEREVIEAHELDFLNDLETAANFALRHRLPDREGATNGLYSELLLDLLLTMYYEKVNKLATRAIYRQMSDNQEIKGFDGLHIVTAYGRKELWLGQAKMGGLNYCVRDIIKDLENKTNMLYTSKQLYFVADKEKTTLDVSLQLLKKINRVSMQAEIMGLGDDKRAEFLRDFFIKEDIKIVLPCLLAYSSPETYEKETEIDQEMKKQVEYMIGKFEDKFKTLIDVDYKVLILFIPIRDLNMLRTKMVTTYGT